MFRSSRPPAPATDLYQAIVTQARDPAFYTDMAVPDTVDGRFEMVALHAFLVLRRLKTAAAPVARLGQPLFDTMFADMDVSLREMGAGDLGVGKRVKAMAEAFYGRISAYDAALADPGAEALGEALRRNVYRTLKPPGAVPPQALATLARYVRASADALASQDDTAFVGGSPRFAAAASGGPSH